MAPSRANSRPGEDPRLSPALYALLGLLALRSWTGYELTEQARRSLKFLWPTSEGHLYREQKRLVRLGWAVAEDERVGRRPRKRYSITPAGRRALEEWTETEPGPPGFEVEGAVRVFFGDLGSVDALVSSMRASAIHSRDRLDQLLGFVDEYLDSGGPFPDRLHVIALAVDILTRLLGDLEEFFDACADEVENWDTTSNRGLDAATRARLERILDTYRRPEAKS